MLNRNVRACAAIVFKNGKVLACKCSEQPNAELWEFPGVELTSDEDSQSACERTVVEELGCNPSTVWILDTVDVDYPDHHLAMDCYVCTLLPTDEPNPKAYGQIRWLGPNELLGVEWRPEHKEAVCLVGTYWDQLFFSEHL